MAYIKAEQVLPIELLNQIQMYIDGEYIYVPRKSNNKRVWGQNSKAKEKTFLRNKEIYSLYQSGISVQQLASKYYLADKTIYSIIAKMRKLY